MGGRDEIGVNGNRRVCCRGAEEYCDAGEVMLEGPDAVVGRALGAQGTI